MVAYCFSLDQSQRAVHFVSQWLAKSALRKQRFCFPAFIVRMIFESLLFFLSLFFYVNTAIFLQVKK